MIVDVNTKTEITDALILKADQSALAALSTGLYDTLNLVSQDFNTAADLTYALIVNVNTKSEITTALSLKAPVDKPLFTGTVAINTPSTTNIDSALVVQGTMNAQPKIYGVHFGTTGYDQ